jgi:predicted ATPase
MTDTNHLHLPSLSVRGFRGIDALTIPRLGPVTLLAGKNGVGKTTVLDAVRVYAARGRYPTLSNLLQERDELLMTDDEEGDGRLIRDWEALFYGRDTQKTCISIGLANDASQLTIGQTASINWNAYSKQPSLFGDSSEDVPVQALEASYRDNQHSLSWAILLDEVARRAPRLGRLGIRSSYIGDDPPPAIACESLGPGRLGNSELARLWDHVALTDDEERAVSALRLIFGDDVERAAVVGDDTTSRRGRRALVRLKGHEHPVPLRSLGDGALRLFGVALALANSRNGFLLIDEAENGIHYSLQRDFWRMVLQTAQENDVQVVATTHSWGCIKGFAQAAIQSEGADGVLVRLSRQYGDLGAVEYSEEELAIASEQGIEVR